MKTYYLRMVILFYICCCPLLSSLTAAREKKPYHITPASSRIKIDGRLDEKAWKDALYIDLLYETQPGENTPAPVNTRCYLSYDRTRLYVAFRAEDPDPARIRSHYSRRVVVWRDDRVGFTIDTFNDRNRAFAFYANILGVQLDVISSRGGEVSDPSWDGIWHTAGKRTPYGYSVEFAIPFRTLRFQRKPGEEQVWGFSAMRVYPRNQEFIFSTSARERGESCILCRFERIKGFKGAAPGKNVELDPTIIGIRTDKRPSGIGDAMKNVESRLDFGLSGHWRVTPNLTLNGAVNPDFSQVEADSAELNINKQFALYFREKRPFFLEGGELFKTPLSAVYTRTVADPDWGVKLSGKSGGNTIGLFVTRDRTTNLLFPGAEYSGSTSMDRKNVSSVLRYQRDIGTSSNIGFLLTGREGEHYHNRVAGVDGLFRFSKADTLTFQFLGSQTLYPEQVAEDNGQETGEFYGTALHLAFRHSTRNWLLDAGYDDYSPGFRVDLGFMPRVDLRRGGAGVSYRHWGKKGDFFSSIIGSLRLSLTHDHGGALLEKRATLSMQFKAPWQSQLAWETHVSRQVVEGIPFDRVYHEIFWDFTPVGDLTVICDFAFGDQVDYDNLRPAKEFYWKPEILYNLGKRVYLALEYALDILVVDNRRLFLAHLPQADLVYHFNNKMLIRGTLQYTYIKREPRLYLFPVDEVSENLYSQVLFSYKLNPRTVLFLGYTDNHMGYMNRRTGFRNFSLRRTDRTFFLKIGYALTL